MAYTPTYTASDMPAMSFDIVGGILQALASQAGTIGILAVVLLVIVLIVDLLTGVFGIFSKLRGIKR